MIHPPFLFGPESAELFQIAQAAIIIVSLILMSISITAYRNTGIKRLRYVISAFALFVSYGSINLVDAVIVDILPDDVRFASVSVILLCILILLFIGFVKKEDTTKGRFKIEKKSTDDLKDLK